ncbi:hypothetical protein J27TS8_40400 [Robertmurraya siralis]|uniref:Uncharacterized protein n=1 Tax=Robertmurraya siralis TaxID=77777 RepID=A0A919WLX7_9BACI|nr:hypothetical protein J27TS8_40400 [Robertmurraya siralis]
MVSECGAKGRPFQWAFKAKAGKRGFQPQSKPPVYTGGFDFRSSLTNYDKSSGGASTIVFLYRKNWTF